jgi:phosphoglycerate dehydrogenase-like enzyme
MISSTRPIVVFTQSSYYPDNLSSVFPTLGATAELRRTEAVTPDELIRDLPPADVAVVRRGRITAEVFRNLPRLRGMVKWGVGVENIDIPAATEAGIIVANSPGNSFAVAEATMLLILAVAKNLLIMTQTAKAGTPLAFPHRPRVRYGRLGLRSLRPARPLRCAGSQAG